MLHHRIQNVKSELFLHILYIYNLVILPSHCWKRLVLGWLQKVFYSFLFSGLTLIGALLMWKREENLARIKCNKRSTSLQNYGVLQKNNGNEVGKAQIMKIQRAKRLR